MRKLSDTPNIGGSNSTYPDGVIIDNAGAVVGTALTEILYGDLVQSIHKLRRLAGISENNLPDNEDNGFQIVKAMMQQGLPTWYPASSKIDFGSVKYVKYGSAIFYHITNVSTNTNPSLDTANWFRVYYWNGTKIVYSDEARIAGIENALSTETTNRTNADTGLSDRINPLEYHVANTTNYNNAYIDRYRPFAVGAVVLGNIGTSFPQVVFGDFAFHDISVPFGGATLITLRLLTSPLVVNSFRALFSVQGNLDASNGAIITYSPNFAAGTQFIQILIREAVSAVQLPASQVLHIELINVY